MQKYPTLDYYSSNRDIAIINIVPLLQLINCIVCNVRSHNHSITQNTPRGNGIEGFLYSLIDNKITMSHIFYKNHALRMNEERISVFSEKECRSKGIQVAKGVR